MQLSRLLPRRKLKRTYAANQGLESPKTNQCKRLFPKEGLSKRAFERKNSAIARVLLDSQILEHGRASATAALGGELSNALLWFCCSTMRQFQEINSATVQPAYQKYPAVLK